MSPDDKPVGRAERLTPSEAMSAPVPVEPELDRLDEVEVVVPPSAPVVQPSWLGRLFGSRPADDGPVDKTTSLDRVMGMVSRGTVGTRITNIVVFGLMLLAGLALIAKLMSPAALEGGMQKGNEAIQGVLQPQ